MTLKEDVLALLRKAMQGEKDSVILYQNAAGSSEDVEIRRFFQSRSVEEKEHYNYLLNYYSQLTGNFFPLELPSNLETYKIYHPIISEDFLRRIAGNQVLFSAISIAVLLERDAIVHYGKCAELAENLTLKTFFGMLVEWETVHYDELLQIQKEAEVLYWQINSFAPF